MPEEPAVLLQLARLNESKRDWPAALDCLERALAAGDDSVRPAVAEAAARIAAAASTPAVKERARTLGAGGTTTGSTRAQIRDKTTRRLAAHKGAPAAASASSAPPAAAGAAGASPPATAPATGVSPSAPSASPPASAAPAEVSTRELAIARELLVTPDVVKALREALAGAAPRPAAEPATLPLERILARLLSCELDYSAAIDLCLDIVLEATGAQRGFMLTRDQHGHLGLARARGLGKADIPGELSTSVLAEAERTGEPVFVNDAVNDPRFGQRASIVSLGLRSVACVPILDREAHQLLGAIYLDDPRVSERFGESERQLLRSLGRLLVGPLRNAQRFEAQRTALARARSPEDTRKPRGQERIVGRSKAIAQMLELLSRVAGEDVPVLIQGESGTGKELAARVIHEASRRSSGPFVAENLAALAPTLVEAELFGVVKGAYTGADRDRDGLFVRATGGTLFLDELGELPLDAQAKLLRVIQEKELRPLGGEKTRKIDARVVCATNRDLDAMVREGTFREDLLYRLRVVKVRVPPLRERAEDIPLLATHILERIADERGEPVAPLSRAALAKLCARPWRGNVRELENVLWRVALTGESALDEPPPGASDETDSEGLRLRVDLPGETVALEDARLAFDRSYVRLVLGRSGGNVARAARALEITRPALSRMLTRLGLREPSRDADERESSERA